MSKIIIDKPGLARRALDVVPSLLPTWYYRVLGGRVDPTPHYGPHGMVADLDRRPVLPTEAGDEDGPVWAEYVPAQVLCDSTDLDALGGRDCFFARRAMEKLCPAAKWRILSLPLGEARYRPGDDWSVTSTVTGTPTYQADGQHSLALLDLWAQHGLVVATSRDGSCVKALLAKDPAGRKFSAWQDLAAAGLLELVGGEKANKRAGQLYRDFRYSMWAQPGLVELRVSERPAYMTPETWKAVGDGMGVISHALWHLLKAETLKRIRLMTDLDAKNRAWTAFKRDQNTRSLNARALGLCPGLLKLQLYVAPPEAGDGFWIETHPENVKRELSAHKDLGEVWLAADPQAPHVGAKLCGQTLQSFPWFYHETKVKRYIDLDIKDLSDDALHVRLNQQLDTVDNTQTLLEEGRLDVGVATRDKLLAARMVTKGVSPLINSALTARLLNYSFNGLVSRDEANVRPTIPGSWYGPVVSHYAARLVVGDTRDVVVDPGEITYEPLLGAFVVADADWVRLIRLCGGCDLDDKFTLVFRKDGRGETMALVHRSPNAKGEFFTAVAVGDLPPGVGDSVPTYKADPWESIDPKADRRDAVELAEAGERPMVFPPLAKKTSRAWTYPDVRADVLEYLLISPTTGEKLDVEADSDPGSGIKWARLYTVLTGRVCDLSGPMEESVDRLVQYGDLPARIWLRARRKVVKKYVEAALRNGAQLDMVEAARCHLETDHKGPMTRLVEYAEAAVAEAKKSVEGFCERAKDLSDQPNWALAVSDKCPAKAKHKRVQARELARMYQDAFKGLRVSPFFDRDEGRWTQLGWAAMDIHAGDLLAQQIAGLQTGNDPTGWLNFVARLAWAATDQECREHKDLKGRHDDKALLRPLVVEHYIDAASKLLNSAKEAEFRRAQAIDAGVRQAAEGLLAEMAKLPDTEPVCELRRRIRDLIAD